MAILAAESEIAEKALLPCSDNDTKHKFYFCLKIDRWLQNISKAHDNSNGMSRTS